VAKTTDGGVTWKIVNLTPGLAAFQAVMMGTAFSSQGIGLRPQSWARLSRPVGPDADGIVIL